MVRAKIGDTIKNKFSDDEFVVVFEEVDENGIQWVWRCDINACDCIFSPCSYGTPSTNFDVVKEK